MLLLRVAHQVGDDRRLIIGMVPL
jgi:hypothetical protein